MAASLAPVSDDASGATAEDADAVASRAASLPQCAAASAALAAADDTTSSSMEPGLYAVAKEAIARAYPGLHLDAVGRRTSLHK